jgi:hypothetical protein
VICDWLSQIANLVYCILRNRHISEKTSECLFLALSFLLLASGWSLQPTKTFFRVFSCSSYVGFVPVSDLLDMYSLIWQGVFSSKFLFVTDPKPKFGWRVFGGPRSPKTFHVLGDPKRFTKTLQCCWGCLDLAMPLGLSYFQIYFTILAIYHLRPAYIV